MSGRYRVTFEPSGRAVWVRPGESVLSAARRAGVTMSATCGGRGTCGECAVRVTEGELAGIGDVEAAGLSRAPAGVRLACQAQVNGPVAVRPVVNLGVSERGLPTSSHARLAAAVDLGTTTVSTLVLEVDSGVEVGRATVPNQQSSWGADVLVRISAALAGDADPLREAAESSVLEAMGQAAPGASACIDRCVIASNTVMAALLAGVDPSPLATHPFAIPAGITQLRADSRIVGSLAPHARISLVPPLASFVGGDVLAGLVASSARTRPLPFLLVDVGTNAEVALVTDRGLFVASAPAGPAFEGAGVSCGGPAVPGAVVGVGVDATGAIEIRTIGQAEARWFSGAGLVSAIALLLRAGHLDTDGVLHEQGEFASLFSRDESGVLGVDFSAGRGVLRLSQLDIRQVQLAKAAVRTAVQFVLEAARAEARALESVLVAGAFGRALAAGDLIELGFVPHEASATIEMIGNSSLAGAVALATGAYDLADIESLRREVTHVELASNERFARALVEAVELRPFSA